jgi:hypothetical protein
LVAFDAPFLQCFCRLLCGLVTEQIQHREVALGGAESLRTNPDAEPVELCLFGVAHGAGFKDLFGRKTYFFDGRLRIPMWNTNAATTTSP